MLKHIVLWKFKEYAEGRSKAENLAIARERLLALKPLIPEIRVMDAGIDLLHTVMSYDLALIVTVDDSDALARYLDHPGHQAVSKLIGKLREQRVVADIPA